jgi:two-component system Ni(II)/redox-responsive regulator NrsR
LEVGPYRFDPQSGQLQVSSSDGVVTIPLAGKERQLMAYFLEHPERIIPGSQLRHQLWDLHQDPVSNVVAAQVRLLRRKLAAHGLASPIETVPSRGYRFLAQLPDEP